MDSITVNPFIHRLHFQRSDYIKIFVGTIFLVPIRVVLTAFLFILTSMMARFFNYLLLIWELDIKSEIEWRNAFKKPCIILLRSMFFVAGFYKVTVVDKRKFPDRDEAQILVLAPHTSPFDIICGLSFNGPSVVVRHDAVDIPFFGNIIRLTNPVFVERDSPTSRQKVLNDVLEKIQSYPVVFFPEGTCSNRKALIQFKPGAFKLGLPIQPVALKYNQFGGLDTLSWTWSGPNAVKLIWLTFSRWRTDFELVKLKVYHPLNEEILNPELYAQNVSLALAQELNLPQLMYSFDDVKYLNYLIFRSPVCLKFLKVCDKFAKETNYFQIKHEIVRESNGVNGVTKRLNNVDTKQCIENNSIDKKNNLPDFVSELVDQTLEKIQSNLHTEILTRESLINLFGLTDCKVCLSLRPTTKLTLYLDSHLIHSNTLNELLHCLQKVTKEPNTLHLALLLHLSDLRVKSLSVRLRNGYDLLAEHETSNNLQSIGTESIKTLLWFALGVDPNIFYESSTLAFSDFDDFNCYLLKNFQNAVEDNCPEIIKERVDDN